MMLTYLKPKNYKEGTYAERMSMYNPVSVADNGLEFYETDTDILYRVCNGDWLAIAIISSFDNLTDTPATKIGYANKIVAVNAGETALEYTDVLPSLAITSSLNLSGSTLYDGTLSSGSVGQFLKRRVVGGGIGNSEWASINVTDLNGTGSKYDIVGFTAANTIGLLTPASDPAGANEVILKTNASGNINLQSGLTFNVAGTLSTSAGTLTLYPSQSIIFKYANSSYYPFVEFTGSGTLPGVFGLYHNSASPANNDYSGSFYFQGNNASATKIEFSAISGFQANVTAGNETGGIRVSAYDNGSNTFPLWVYGNAVRIGGTTIAAPSGLIEIASTAGIALYTNSGLIRLGDIINFAGTMGNSTKDPTTDAPADWVECQIGGVTRYLAAYAG